MKAERQSERQQLDRQRETRARVWDPMVRIGHWSLASFFLLAYWLGGDRLNLHSHAGYTVALLVGFRVIWGWLGPDRARFADFVVSPPRVADYLRRLVTARSRGDVPVHLGHDPAGAVMIMALLIVLAATACSGMVLFAMENRGPLPHAWVADWPGSLVEAVHHTAADVSLILVIAHVTGVLVMSLILRQNLIGAMVHGYKHRHKPGCKKGVRR